MPPDGLNCGGPALGEVRSGLSAHNILGNPHLRRLAGAVGATLLPTAAVAEAAAGSDPLGAMDIPTLAGCQAAQHGVTAILEALPTAPQPTPPFNGHAAPGCNG